MRRRRSSYKLRQTSESFTKHVHLAAALHDQLVAMQVQKLQSGNARQKEQHSLAEENMRSLHVKELSAKDGDIRLLQERCDDAVKQNEVQRTDSAAKVCFDSLQIHLEYTTP